MFKADKHKWVLTSPCPPKPNTKSVDAHIIEHNWWKQFEEMAKCYMLDSMSNTLYHLHHGMDSATDMMLNVDEMFVDLGC